MKVQILTNWYNEEFMAPLFLIHYSWADLITIVLEPSTNDGTREEIGRRHETWDNAGIAKRPNVELIEHAECAGLIDDAERAHHDSRIICQSDSDWVIRVDSDEFIFPTTAGPRSALAMVPDHRACIMVCEWQVYRHQTDLDINRRAWPVPQRRHGSTDRTDSYSAAYIKPAIMRPGFCPQIGVGCHNIDGFGYNIQTRTIDGQRVHGGAEYLALGYATGPDGARDERVAIRPWSGVHWAKADPCFIGRRIANATRFGGWNKRVEDAHWSGKDKPTVADREADLVSELAMHLDDPEVI